MTPLVHERIADLFAADGDEAAELLERECGANLPLVADALTLERIRVACVKRSGGSLDELKRAIAVAKIDWRAVLAAAGFAHGTRAHERGKPRA